MNDDGQTTTMASRAAEAERRAEALASRLAETERALAEAREALDASERRRQIEREVARAEALDVEAAVLLTEAAIAHMDEVDVAQAVAELKRNRPYLFRSNGRLRASAMSAHVAPGRGELVEAAERARSSGDRGELMRYLRLRRAAM